MQKGNKASVVKEQKVKANLEAGFTNHFSGANHDRALKKDKELRERSKSKSISISKRPEDTVKKAWNDRANYWQETDQKAGIRASGDRYSQHSEDEEYESNNKVDCNG